MPCQVHSTYQAIGRQYASPIDYIDGELSRPTEDNSGVKQGCKLTPTLFDIYICSRRTTLSFQEHQSILRH